eukprot:TRINITY_DN4474_c0_g1_i3.p1 TRINITY_DN4474_c0_g1~~TRINITY_DN4474_c0_g1_i3.p1  ORF type:complete len:479 (+),score=23.28 TRINITY_DN4474_c0_g1_i3:148-1584(+)
MRRCAAAWLCRGRASRRARRTTLTGVLGEYVSKLRSEATGTPSMSDGAAALALRTAASLSSQPWDDVVEQEIARLKRDGYTIGRRSIHFAVWRCSSVRVALRLLRGTEVDEHFALALMKVAVRSRNVRAFWALWNRTSERIDTSRHLAWVVAGLRHAGMRDEAFHVFAEARRRREVDANLVAATIRCCDCMRSLQWLIKVTTNLVEHTTPPLAIAVAQTAAKLVGFEPDLHKEAASLVLFVLRGRYGRKPRCSNTRNPYPEPDLVQYDDADPEWSLDEYWRPDRATSARTAAAADAILLLVQRGLRAGPTSSKVARWMWAPAWAALLAVYRKGRDPLGGKDVWQLILAEEQHTNEQCVVEMLRLCKDAVRSMHDDWVLLAEAVFTEARVAGTIDPESQAWHLLADVFRTVGDLGARHALRLQQRALERDQPGSNHHQTRRRRHDLTSAVGHAVDMMRSDDSVAVDVHRSAFQPAQRVD